MRYVRSVMKLSDVEEIRESGLISVSQAAAIASHFGLDERGIAARSRRYLFGAFAAVGAILVFAGLALLAAAYWEAIPVPAKQIGAGAIMLVLWLLGLIFTFKSEPRPLLGETLCVLGAGMFLVNILLCGQIYKIAPPAHCTLGVWFLGIFLIPLFVRLRGVFALSILVALACLLSFLSADAFKEEERTAFVLAFFIIVSAVGVLFAARKGEARERSRGYAAIALWIPFTVAVLIAQIALYKPFPLPPAEAKALGAAAAIFFLAQLWHARALPRGRRFGGFLQSALLFAVPALPLVRAVGEPLFPAGTTDAILMIFLFLQGSAAMAYGARAAQKFYVNAGALVVLLAAIAAISKIVGSLTQSGTALVVAGAFLLIVGFILERRRRKISAEIDSADESESEDDDTAPKSVSAWERAAAGKQNVVAPTSGVSVNPFGAPQRKIPLPGVPAKPRIPAPKGAVPSVPATKQIPPAAPATPAVPAASGDETSEKAASAEAAETAEKTQAPAEADASAETDVHAGKSDVPAAQ